MTDDNELTPREAAIYAKTHISKTTSARRLAEFKQHAHEIHGARERLKTPACPVRHDLDDLCPSPWPCAGAYGCP